jgi:NADPH:quinone reductase-like Zn-dependent oxidoreductase
MRAVAFAAFGGPEVLEIIDAPVPEPGPDQIRIAVGAAGVNGYDWKLRRGLMGSSLPKRVGLEVAGTVDAVGASVSDVVVGDRVFGFAIGGGAADFTLSAHYAVLPAGLDFSHGAALPVAVETASRALDAVGVGPHTTVLINGASGGVGQAAVQLAIHRGARVIGTASAANHPLLRELGAVPVTYGAGLIARVRALGSSPVDVAVDVAGGGVLADLIKLTGQADQVVTIADFAGAQATGVPFSGTTSAYGALAQVAGLIEAGSFSLAVQQTFALEQIGAAQALSEQGHASGKLVVVLGANL